jgi:hypothetical protein
MALRLTSEQVQAILVAGTFDALLTAIEDEHLECKRAPYQLDEEHHKQELAKDISGLANMSARLAIDGGHVLVGARTEKSPQHHADVVVGVSPFEPRLVDPATLYQILEAWVVPVPEGLTVRWYPSGADPTRGIVAITVPRQRPELWPFIVAKVVEEKSGKVAGTLIGYYERRRDNVVGLSAAELQRLLKDGRRFDSLTEQVGTLAEEVRALRQHQTAPPAIAKISSALEQHRQRRGMAVAAAGLNDVPAFALTAAPVEPVTLPTLFRGRDEPLVRLLEHPPELREGGFDLAVGEPARIVRGEIRRAVVPERMALECWPDGTLIFAAQAGDFLCWGTQRRPGAPLQINPLALGESTYLFVELARLVYEHAQPLVGSIEFSLTLYRIDPGPRWTPKTGHTWTPENRP